MSEREKRTAPANTSTRRQVIAGLGIALGGLAAGSELWANTPQAMEGCAGRGRKPDAYVSSPGSRL
jgi:hypothetical protein